MRYNFNSDVLNLDLIEEYSALFNPKSYNWVDYTFIHAHVEADRMHGNFEIEFIVLGLGFRLYWVYSKRKNDEAMKRYDKILKESNWYSLSEAEDKIDEV